jgi:Na+/proline symporter
LPKEHDFYTTAITSNSVTDPAGSRVATALVGVGSLALLAGQLIAGAAILNVITGMPRVGLGAATGGAIMTVYFTAGGLLGTAWVNTLQLLVMLGGFLIAVAGRAQGGGRAGSALVCGPAAILSRVLVLGRSGLGLDVVLPSWSRIHHLARLIQKAYGGASAAAVRTGVLLNAVALLLFAFVPVLMGSSPGRHCQASPIPTPSFRRSSRRGCHPGWVRSRCRPFSPPRSTPAMRSCS